MDTDTTVRKIEPNLNGRRPISLLNLQQSALRTLFGIHTEHHITCTHAKRLGRGHLVNDFCKSGGDEEEEKAELYQFGTCPGFYSRRK